MAIAVGRTSLLADMSTTPIHGSAPALKSPVTEKTTLGLPSTLTGSESLTSAPNQRLGFVSPPATGSLGIAPSGATGPITSPTSLPTTTGANASQGGSTTTTSGSCATCDSVEAFVVEYWWVLAIVVVALILVFAAAG